MTSSLVYTSSDRQEALHSAGEEAARQAILLAHNSLPQYTHGAITIQKDSLGKPYGIYGDASSPINISISHSFPFALGVATTKKHILLGADIERVRHFAHATWESFLTPREKTVISRAHHTTQAHLRTLCWSLKEATLKALGVGLRLHPKHIDVAEALLPRAHRATILIRNIPVSAQVNIRRIAPDFIATTIAIPHSASMIGLVSSYGRT